MVALGRPLHLFFVLFVLGCFWTSNQWLSLFSVVVLFLIFKLIWIIRAPAILVYCLCFQWVQSSVRLIQANIVSQNINEFGNSTVAGTSIFLALNAVLISTIILHLILKRKHFSLEKMNQTLSTISLTRTFIVWLIFFLLTPIFKFIQIGGLSQIVYPLLSIKWILYCLIFLLGSVQKKGSIYFWSIFSTELLLGFTGYFSEFKTVIFFSLIIGMSIIESINFRNFILSLSIILTVLPLALFWTSVKADFRGYINQGKSAQIVLVNRSQALAFIREKFNAFNFSQAIESVEPLLDRIQYTRMLQFVLEYVPNDSPHEDGKLWGSAINHVLTPRLLFPNKAALNDSEIANKYTGHSWAGVNEGTSIGIGFFAESYVDFGSIGMYFPIAVLALIVGGIYSFFVSRTSVFWILDYLATIPILIAYDKIETSGIKLLGGLIMTFLVYLFIVRRVIFPLIWSYIVIEKGENQIKS